MLFMTTGLAVILIVLRFAVGSVIGLAVVAVIYRSRIGVTLALRGALFAGAGFLIASGIVGWAGSHSAFQNGKRLDLAPWGEDLRLRNRIAENELVLCVSGSVLAALLAGVRLRKASPANSVQSAR
jgi:hypothetical protein